MRQVRSRRHPRPASSWMFEREAHALRAMAHPKRLMIVDLLAHSGATVTGLAEELDLAMPNVSQHLRVMRDQGIVRAERSGHAVRYRLSNPALGGCCARIRRILSQSYAE
ncbi:MAG: winged helix-turn-helix transcriptional regulator [Euryarchaeota archaeon]|nr:winged helix-turn-helix transcriptional regulator [Euryarchaeota archaeon]MDE1880021.1 winged helix-turn-helix transcriptional regulator [Euryarchaeota archaeon]